MQERPSEGVDVRVHIASIDTAAATELAVRSSRVFAGEPFELVVGDGGSTDGSVEMLRQLEQQGLLSFEGTADGRSHAEWLDDWVERCDRRYAVFVDSDVEFLRHGWLADMVRVADETSAALVCAELLEGNPHYIHPITGDEARLEKRPSPWLVLVDPASVRATSASFAYMSEDDPAAPGGAIAYDVGADLFRRLEGAGLHCAVMPTEFRKKYRHFGGLSWKPLRGRYGFRQAKKIATVRWRLTWVRRSQSRACLAGLLSERR